MSFESKGQLHLQTLVVEQAITGSIFKTMAGMSYIAAGSNVTVSSASNGQITISSISVAGSTGSLGNNLSFARTRTVDNGTMISTGNMIIAPNTFGGPFSLYLPLTATMGTTFFFPCQQVFFNNPFTLIATGSSNITRLDGLQSSTLVIDQSVGTPRSFALSLDDNQNWQMLYEELVQPPAVSLAEIGFSTEFPTTETKYLPAAQGRVSNLVLTTGSNVLFAVAKIAIQSVGVLLPSPLDSTQSITGTLQTSIDGQTWTDVVVVTGSGTNTGGQFIEVDFGQAPLTGSWFPLWALKMQSTLTASIGPIYGIVKRF